MQLALPGVSNGNYVKPFRSALLKWVGSKQRIAHEIVSYFPEKYGTYFEPFLGSGAVLGTLAPRRAVGSDNFGPLMEIWRKLKNDPDELKRWYAERWHALMSGEKKEVYENIKSSYNTRPNGSDLLFLCRACYGGVVRFRKTDGYMSTPCGVHDPISPEAFSRRADVWHQRTSSAKFIISSFEETMETAKPGDLIYCDPPYSHSQSILYGAQDFHLERLLETIYNCKSRGVFVALSIDGSKKSGDNLCELPVPEGLFEREVFVNCGRSMLKRFQMNGQTLEGEVVKDRLLLTY